MTEAIKDDNRIRQGCTMVPGDLASEETSSIELQPEVGMSRRSVPLKATINPSVISTLTIPQISNEDDNPCGSVRSEKIPLSEREKSSASSVVQFQNRSTNAGRNQLERAKEERGKEATAVVNGRSVKSVEPIAPTVEVQQHHSITTLPIDSLHWLASFLLPSEWSNFGECSKASNRICRDIIKRVKIHGFRCATEVVTALVSKVTHVCVIVFVC